MVVHGDPQQRSSNIDRSALVPDPGCLLTVKRTRCILWGKRKKKSEKNTSKRLHFDIDLHQSAADVKCSFIRL